MRQVCKMLELLICHSQEYKIYENVISVNLWHIIVEIIKNGGFTVEKIGTFRLGNFI